MPYVARHRIDAGEHVIYDIGQEVPEEIVDEGMVEAGSVERVTKKQLAALADADVSRKSNKELRRILDEDYGIETSPRANHDALVELVESAQADAPEAGGDKPAGDDGEDKGDGEGDGEPQGQGDGGE